jgi:isopenicillin N synthase-like dioxygenase
MKKKLSKTLPKLFSRLSVGNFSTNETLELPVIDYDKYLNKRSGWESECKKVTECLEETGVLVVKDPRANEDDNNKFIRMMEKYYEQAADKYYNGSKLEDAFPEHAYQHGVTPEYKEKARAHCERFASYDKDHKPISICPPIYDSKWRYFWTVGERNKEADEGMMIYPNDIPKGFPQWQGIMDGWGNKMLSACETAAKMAAVGLKLPENTFYDLMKFGGHLLAPTGSDLAKFDEGTIFAGVHYDLNFLTIHGKSNYGGLFIWLRNGKKMKVKVPDACLLLQSGIQFEYLTGGKVLCGFHEVVYTKEVKEAVEKVKEDNKSKPEHERKSLFRISSTLFSQIRQNVTLEPLAHFKNEQTLKKYPPILTRDQVANELKEISLMI